MLFVKDDWILTTTLGALGSAVGMIAALVVRLSRGRDAAVMAAGGSFGLIGGAVFSWYIIVAFGSMP